MWNENLIIYLKKKHICGSIVHPLTMENYKQMKSKLNASIKYMFKQLVRVDLLVSLLII